MLDRGACYIQLRWMMQVKTSPRSLILREDQAGVSSSEAEAIRNGYVDVLLLSLEWDKVELGLGVGVVQVQCGRKCILPRISYFIVINLKAGDRQLASAIARMENTASIAPAAPRR